MDILFYLLVFFCSSLSAQELSKHNLGTLIVEESHSNNNYVESDSTSASRVVSDSLVVPYSVSVVNLSLLRDSNNNRLEDSAMFMSGVEQSSNESGLNTDLIIRGFSTRGATFLNGLSDNQRFQVRDLALIERIEILKGHSSVLYGSGSPGGAVNYISKKPLSTKRHRLSFESGSYDFFRLVSDSSGPVNGHQDLLYRVITVGQLANDFRANISNDRATIAPSLSWQYADSGLFTLDFEYSYENQPFHFDNVYTQNQFVFDQSYVDPRAQSDRHHFRISSSLQQQLSEMWSIQLSSQYFYTKRNDVLFGFFTFVDESTLSGYYRDIDDNYNQLNLRAELLGQLDFLGSQHQLIFGFERNDSSARLLSERNIGGFSLDIYQPDFNHAIPATKPLNRDTDITEYGYYLHDQVDLSSWWHIFTGIRYSSFQADRVQNGAYTQLTNNHAISYNAGVSFTPWTFLSTYFGYSESFQPNYGVNKERHFLPAKRGRLYEFGTKVSLLAGRINLASALYHLTQTNLTTRDPNDPDYVVTNGSMASDGFELQVAGKINNKLSIMANYSLIHARFTQHDRYQGNALRSTPTHSGALWLKYQLTRLFVDDRFSFGGGLVFVGRRQGDDANNFKLPGYARVDTFARYQIERLSLQFNMENLLDKRYASSSIYDDTVVQGNRRLFRVQVGIQL